MLNTFVDVLTLQLFQNMNPLKLSPSNMIIHTALPEVTKVDDMDAWQRKSTNDLC